MFQLNICSRRAAPAPSQARIGTALGSHSQPRQAQVCTAASWHSNEEHAACCKGLAGTAEAVNAATTRHIACCRGSGSQCCRHAAAAVLAAQLAQLEYGTAFGCSSSQQRQSSSSTRGSQLQEGQRAGWGREARGLDLLASDARSRFCQAAFPYQTPAAAGGLTASQACHGPT